MAKDVYVVVGEEEEYADYAQWLVAAFDTKQAALDWAQCAQTYADQCYEQRTKYKYNQWDPSKNSDYPPLTRVEYTVVTVPMNPQQTESTGNSNEREDMMTAEQAKALAKTEWWKDASDVSIVDFQLFAPRVCMNFGDFHLACERVFGHPIWSHQFGDRDYVEALKTRFIEEHGPSIWQNERHMRDGGMISVHLRAANKYDQGQTSTNKVDPGATKDRMKDRMDEIEWSVTEHIETEFDDDGTVIEWSMTEHIETQFDDGTVIEIEGDNGVYTWTVFSSNGDVHGPKFEKSLDEAKRRALLFAATGG